VVLIDCMLKTIGCDRVKGCKCDICYAFKKYKDTPFKVPSENELRRRKTALENRINELFQTLEGVENLLSQAKGEISKLLHIGVEND
jgi:hypothetical protein